LQLLRRLILVLAFVLITVSLVSVKPAYANYPLGVVTVQGTDNGVYWLFLDNHGPETSWASLAGGTSASPTLCWDGYGTDNVELVLRGTDSHIYHKAYASGTWTSSWDSVGATTGTTNLSPACAVTGGYLIVVVVGTDSGLYYTRCALPCSGSWSAWQGLRGATPNAPTLVASLSGRLDLFVRGTDNGIYHKAYTSGTWSSSWDKAPSGSTLDAPAAALFTLVTGCPSCLEGDTLYVVVRGTDSGVYYNLYGISTPGWGAGWTSLSGSTKGTPMIVSDPTVCQPGSTSNCNGLDELVVWGTDGSIYSKSYSGTWASTWLSPGGTAIYQPAFGYGDPYAAGAGETEASGFGLVVAGTGGVIYYNILSHNYPFPTASDSWGSWNSLGGGTPSGPAITQAN
jgi:hypothetical protein